MYIILMETINSDDSVLFSWNMATSAGIRAVERPANAVIMAFGEDKDRYDGPFLSEESPDVMLSRITVCSRFGDFGQVCSRIATSTEERVVAEGGGAHHPLCGTFKSDRIAVDPSSSHSRTVLKKGTRGISTLCALYSDSMESAFSQMPLVNMNCARTREYLTGFSRCTFLSIIEPRLTE